MHRSAGPAGTRANRELTARHGLGVIPTVLVFMRGEVVARFTGTVAPEQLVAAVLAALERVRALPRDELEPAAATSQKTSSPLRSVLDRRANSPALAHAD